MTTAKIRTAIRAALKPRVGRGEIVRVRTNGAELHPAGEDDWSGDDSTLAEALRLVTPATRSLHVHVYVRDGLDGGGGDELDRGYYVRIADDGAVRIENDY